MEAQQNIEQVRDMTFGMAIDALKRGRPVAREGWNGKNMCLSLNLGRLPIDKDENKGALVEGVSREFFEESSAGTVLKLPYISLRTPTGSCVTGWLASQTDMLAEDWCIVNVDDWKQE